MKVVFFCGGLGLRLYPTTENIPKPLIHVGDKPILWHLMKYYSYFGHKEFILCLGYKGDRIKNYFARAHDIKDCKITFVDTGLNSNIGQRLKAVAKYVEGEEMFLANYSDVLTDLYLPRLIDFFIKRKKICCFLCVRPYQSFHIVSMKKNDLVKTIHQVGQSDIRINGGFFVFRKNIFSYINEGEDLVNEPFQRLIEKQELLAYKYDGFWACMDTFKDKQRLDDMFYNSGTPWGVWKHSERVGNRGGV